jgi:hypothetical protein
MLTLRLPVESRPNDEAFRPRVVFSPDGWRLAASAWTGAVTMWDAAPESRPASVASKTRGP